ncbi:MAG: NAD-dependent epimerase/dehydratase family protein [Desertimonas sp.]
MRALVTGGAGFIGSALAERLIDDGWSVHVVDALTPYYDERLKRANLAELERHGIDRITIGDVGDADLAALLEGVDVVFNFAAEPGVRPSWDGFDRYVRHNLTATERLLAAARHHGIGRFVHASSSSVYGQITGSVDEGSPTVPYSPYGVTKLASELLARAYAENFALPTVTLRLFTVYGPRQRPDMAMHRLLRCALTQTPFPVFGDGSQIRAFTYVGDVVEAAIAAAGADIEPGAVFNISGGSTCSLREVITAVEAITGRPVPLAHRAASPGDVGRTDADITSARRHLGWRPATGLASGLRRQLTVVQDRLGLAIADS